MPVLELPRSQRAATRRQPTPESLLRDMAFVLQATRKVRQSMTKGKAPRCFAAGAR
jgi:hypothetical protein